MHDEETERLWTRIDQMREDYKILKIRYQQDMQLTAAAKKQVEADILKMYATQVALEEMD
jgi:hypothetical protein